MAEYVYGFVPFEEIPEFKMVRREEVVRCRDCKHMYEHDLSAYYGNHEYDQCSCCRLLDPGAISVEPDGFCAWGERNGVVNEQTSTKLEPTRTELKSCPFCGGEAELRYHPSSMRDPECRAWEVGCSICDARVGSTVYAIGKTKAEAIAAWNRRAQ